MMEFHNEQFVGVSPIQELESLELQYQSLEEQLREKGIKFEDVHPILNNGIVNELDKYLIEPGNAIVRE